MHCYLFDLFDVLIDLDGAGLVCANTCLAGNIHCHTLITRFHHFRSCSAMCCHDHAIIIIITSAIAIVFVIAANAYVTNALLPLMFACIVYLRFTLFHQQHLIVVVLTFCLMYILYVDNEK